MNAPAIELAFGAAGIRFGAEADSWQDAVRQTGGLLIELGLTTGGYTRRMIEVIETFGPYVVVAPGVALAHARPGSDVLRNGAVILTFPAGVAFGHNRNDPVRAVIGISVRKPEEHVAIIASVARLLNEPGAVDELFDTADEAALAAGVIERLHGSGLVRVVPLES